MSYLQVHTLQTASQIISYIEELSYFIDRVYIREVHTGGFSFMVRVPMWYKLFFGRMLRKTIQENLQKRLYVGVEFQFNIYSKKLF